MNKLIKPNFSKVECLQIRGSTPIFISDFLILAQRVPVILLINKHLQINILADTLQRIFSRKVRKLLNKFYLLEYYYSKDIQISF